MAAHHFIVTPDGTHWKYSFHGTDHGPYVTREEALDDAIAGAKAAAADGIEVEVLVHDLALNAETAWKSDGA